MSLLLQDSECMRLRKCYLLVMLYVQMIFMSRSAYNKRRLREKRLDTSHESIYIDTRSEKLKKEENERKLREQEATRESD